MSHTIRDIFGNELKEKDSIISVTVYKGKPKFRKGFVQEIQETPREAAIIIKNIDTKRSLIKYVSSKNAWSASDVLKINWVKENHREPSLF